MGNVPNSILNNFSVPNADIEKCKRNNELLQHLDWLMAKERGPKDRKERALQASDVAEYNKQKQQRLDELRTKRRQYEDLQNKLRRKFNHQKNLRGAKGW